MVRLGSDRNITVVQLRTTFLSNIESFGSALIDSPPGRRPKPHYFVRLVGAN
jgi:hypothetical protein